MLRVKAKRPSETFAAIFKTARLCSAIVGTDVSNPNHRVNWVTGAVICSIIGYLIFTTVTIIEKFPENPTYMLEAFCMLASVVQGITKMTTGIIYTKDIVSTRFELEAIYTEFEGKDRNYDAALFESCRRINKIIKVVGVVYLIGVLGVLLTPFVMMALSGQRHLTMHFLVPGLDVDRNIGYFLTLAAHSTCMIFGGFGLYAGDMFVMIYLSHAFLFVDIFKLKIELFNECSADNGKSHLSTDLLKDILRWHQKYMNINKVSNNTFYYIISVQVSTAGMSIVCTLFILVTSDWPGAYSYLLISIIGLYIYCILGTQIDTCNDNFSYEIYNINWYNLSVPEQKMVRMMLMQSQKPAMIDVAGVMPLSVSTALQITKMIYSLFMMMVQFYGD